jgi:hypothetical protein
MRCVPIEAGDAVQCRRPSLEKRLMRGSALGAVAQPFARYAVVKEGRLVESFARRSGWWFFRWTLSELKGPQASMPITVADEAVKHLIQFEI